MAIGIKKGKPTHIVESFFVECVNKLGRIDMIKRGDAVAS